MNAWILLSSSYLLAFVGLTLTVLKCLLNAWLFGNDTVLTG